LRRVFYYIFEGAHIGGGLPQIIPHTVRGDFLLFGLEVAPFPVIHGQSEVTGYRFSDGEHSFAFVTDCNLIPPASLDKMRGLDLLIIDALRYSPHPTHLHVDQALAYISELKPRRALLTHISHDIKHKEASLSLPDGIELAYDGLKINL
jgi:phosphoribosyl 1,2-cyclic phosphate phosphodiesterase